MLSKEEIKNINDIKDMLDYASGCIHSNLQLDNKSSKLLYSYIEQLEKENKMFKDFYISCGNKDIADNITATKYCQIRESAYWEGYAQKQKEAIEICKQCKDRNKVEQLETNNQTLIKTNDKYLQKLVFALTPTTHELSTNNNNAFKKIIADNIDLETCKIKRKLKEFWGIDKY